MTTTLPESLARLLLRAEEPVRVPFGGMVHTARSRPDIIIKASRDTAWLAAQALAELADA
jgi:hypothetical protein